MAECYQSIETLNLIMIKKLETKIASVKALQKRPAVTDIMMSLVNF